MCIRDSHKILHNLCFSFLLGITAVLREIENDAYVKFWGANKVYYERCASGVFIFECKFNKNRTKEKVLCERREARKDKQTTEYKKLMLEARNEK